MRFGNPLTWLAAAALLLAGCGFGGGDEGVVPERKRKLVSKVGYLDSSGTQRMLAEHIGKVVLVDVWATWCPPCRTSLPEIAALQQQGKREDYVVLAISVDKEGWEAVRPYLNANPQLGLQAALPVGRGALAPFGRISGIPTTIVVDRHGRLRERWSGYYEGRAAKALREALAEP